MAVVDKISAVQKEFGVTDYDLSEELQFGLMEVVYEWGRGIVECCYSIRSNITVKSCR